MSYPTYTGSQYDASTTNLTYLIPNPTSNSSSRPLEIVLSFLSPITPTSTLRQAIPASYLTVHVQGDFNIDVYVDLNGQWVSEDRGSSIVWDFTHINTEGETKGLKSWSFKRETELLFTEYGDRAEWGTLHFTAPSVGILSSRLQNLGDLFEFRTSAMNLELLPCCASDFPGQVL